MQSIMLDSRSIHWNFVLLDLCSVHWNMSKEAALTTKSPMTGLYFTDLIRTKHKVFTFNNWHGSRLH